MFFLVSNLPNLIIFVWKKIGKKSANSKKNCKQQKSCQNFEITNLKEKRLLLMSKNLKKSNNSKLRIPTSNLFENF
jgi:hypothetical protein